MTALALGRNLKTLAKRTVEPALYRLFPRYAFYRARRNWNQAALFRQCEVTATFDAGDWDTYWTSGWRDLRLLLEVARSAGPLGSEFAVELGCGLGRLTKPLAEHFQAVLGVDIAVEMLRRAREQAAAPNIAYELVGSDSTLPLPDSVADLAIAWTVFRHMAKSTFETYLDELRRVLKPGGSLVFEAQIREVGAPAEPPPYDSFSEREYTRPELQSYCAAHGFSWRAERSAPSVTAGTATLIVAWHRDGAG